MNYQEHCNMYSVNRLVTEISYKIYNNFYKFVEQGNNIKLNNK